MAESSYIQTTVPSDYDVDVGWYCTIGKAELESAARAFTSYLQANGDEWRSVLLAMLPHECRRMRPWNDREAETVEMSQRWLELLQRVRVRRPGPSELILNAEARGGLQLRYPNGGVVGAAHHFNDEQMAELAEEAAKLRAQFYPDEGDDATD